MAAFYRLLVEFFSKLFGNFLGITLKRFPIILLFISMSVIIVGTYLTAMNTIVLGLQLTVPTTVLQVWGWFMPSNMSFVISSIYGAKIVKFLHYKYLDALQTKAKALSGSS